MRVETSRWLAAAAALGLAAAPAAASWAAEPDPAETRKIMREVFDALRQVLPASLDERRFGDEQLHPQVRDALGTLARRAEALEAHGARSGAGFTFLAGALARDTQDIERRYLAGRTNEARYLLHELTNTCVACHSRLPDTKDAPLAASFMDETRIAALDLPDRAQIAMATRQFDRALAAHEAMLESNTIDISSIDLLGYLDDYLEVCLRVKGDYERPARTLAAFSGRDDVRKELRDTLRIWVEDLREIGARAPIEGLEAARALVIDAEAKLGERDEHALAVRYQTASGALQRYVASLPAEDPRAAEAYYWLGLIESRIGRSFWISQTEPYLEAVIRLAPGAPLARDAYALLEEFVVGGYTGSGGENVPDDVRAHLDALAHRIAAASAASEIERDELAGRVARGIAPLILDVRTPAEYARGHVPGARNIPHDQLAEQLDALAEHREREIVVYCESGRRAAHATETLEDAGFRGVRHLEGDMAGWRKAGLPTE